MLVSGQHQRTVQMKGDEVLLIDQTLLPHEFKLIPVKNVTQMEHAIKSMQVRGAPAIGAAAAFGIYLAADQAARSANPAQVMQQAAKLLKDSRPTAINLAWAVDRQLQVIAAEPDVTRWQALLKESACNIADEDAGFCQSIGKHGVGLIEEIARRKNGQPVNIMTHCNAGWLATVDFGTATAPIYEAQSRGIPIHVWVSETRPRCQGALTAWELGQQSVPHSIIVDNAAGIIMQQGLVDILITGSDRTTRTGDVCNKIGTYMKALAAKAHGIPFYAALPSSTIDWTLSDGPREIPIEERAASEILEICGQPVYAAGSAVKNPGFDVTPRSLVSGIITERGVCAASEAGLLGLFWERGSPDPHVT